MRNRCQENSIFLQPGFYCSPDIFPHSSVLLLCSDTHKPQSIILVQISSEACAEWRKVNWYLLTIGIFSFVESFEWAERGPYEGRDRLRSRWSKMRRDAGVGGGVGGVLQVNWLPVETLLCSVKLWVPKTELIQRRKQSKSKVNRCNVILSAGRWSVLGRIEVDKESKWWPIFFQFFTYKNVLFGALSMRTKHCIGLGVVKQKACGEFEVGWEGGLIKMNSESIAGHDKVTLSRVRTKCCVWTAQTET